MSEIKIIFHSEFPEPLQDDVESLLKPHLHIVAPYIFTIHVIYGSGEDEIASVKTMRRYHRADIELHPAFFRQAWTEREGTVVHELMHSVVDIYSREVVHVLRQWVPEEVFQYVWDRLEDSEEEVVDYLSHLYLIELTREAPSLTLIHTKKPPPEES